MSCLVMLEIEQGFRLTLGASRPYLTFTGLLVGYAALRFQLSVGQSVPNLWSGRPVGVS